MDNAFEEIAEEHRINRQVANCDGWNRQQKQAAELQPMAFRAVSGLVPSRDVLRAHRRHGDRHCWHGHLPWRAPHAYLYGLSEPLFPVKNQEIHAERVESGNKHTCHHREINRLPDPVIFESATASMIESPWVKPEKNGVPIRASRPISEVIQVIGIYLRKPPILRIS